MVRKDGRGNEAATFGVCACDLGFKVVAASLEGRAGAKVLVGMGTEILSTSCSCLAIRLIPVASMKGLPSKA